MPSRTSRPRQPQPRQQPRPFVSNMVTLSEIEITDNEKEKDYRLMRVIDYYSVSRDVNFSVEFRPSLKKKSNGEWNPHPNRLWPEDTWTGIKKLELTSEIIHTIHDNPDVSHSKRPPDLYKVSIASTFFIGMDVIRMKPVVTDRNPNLEGLVDIHRCVYLPSAYEKNQHVPDYLAQKVTFLELPDAPLHTPGIAPGLFFITPKLCGCNIFVAHDDGLHKYWVVRVSCKNPHRPPELRKRPVVVPTNEKQPDASKQPGPASKKDGGEAVGASEDKQQAKVGGGEAAQASQSQPQPTEAAVPEDVPRSGIIPMNRFDAEEMEKIERKRKILQHQKKNSGDLIDLDPSIPGEASLKGYGSKKATENWNPPQFVMEARLREMEKHKRKPRSWNQNFREYKAYAELVLDHLRKNGYNADFVLRVATDRDWNADVREQKFWVDDLNKEHKVKHHLYRGEAVFYGLYQGGTWKFGLKDLGLAGGRVNKMNSFPLDIEGSAFRLIPDEEEENTDPKTLAEAMGQKPKIEKEDKAAKKGEEKEEPPASATSKPKTAVKERRLSVVEIEPKEQKVLEDFRKASEDNGTHQIEVSDTEN